MRVGIRVVAFLLACLFGIGISSFKTPLSRSVSPGFRIGGPSTGGFSLADVREKLHKQVRSKALANMKVSPEDTRGRVAFFYVDEQRKRWAVIDWDVWVDGKHVVLSIDRDNYERSIVEE